MPTEITCLGKFSENPRWVLDNKEDDSFQLNENAGLGSYVGLDPHVQVFQRRLTFAFEASDARFDLRVGDFDMSL